MGLVDVNKNIIPGHKGGGMLGSVLGGAGGAILGGVIGGLAAVPTGGASLAAVPAIAAGAAAGVATGTGAGMSIGNMAGEAVDPTTAPSESSNVPLTQGGGKSAPMMALAKAPEVQMAQMQNSKNLLRTSDIPKAADYISMIDQAMQTKRETLGNSSSMFPKFA